MCTIMKARRVVQLKMTTNEPRQSVVRNVPDGHIVEFTIHINHLYKIPSIVDDMFKKCERNTHLLPSAEQEKSPRALVKVG
jgi:hypothetical protein